MMNLRTFYRFAMSAISAGMMAIPIAAVARQPGDPGITFEGTAQTGTDMRRVQFRFFCTWNTWDKGPNTTGALSALGNLGVEMKVPNFKQLRGIFNFDPFEGPEAEAGSLALTHLQAGGVQTTKNGSFTAAGSVAADPSTSFVLAVAEQQTATFGALANLLRQLVDGPSHFVWRQGNATSGGASIQASLKLSVADAARLRTALGTCLPAKNSAGGATTAERQPPDVMRDTFVGCTWGKVEGAHLEIWAYSCDPEHGNIRIVADDTLPGFVAESAGPDGAGRSIVVQAFAKAADSPIDAVLDAVRAASPGPHSDTCVFVPAPALDTEYGAGPFTFEPTGGAKTAWDASISGPNSLVGSVAPPCGKMGPAEEGDRYFQVLPNDPQTVVFVELGSEIQPYDVSTLRARAPH